MLGHGAGATVKVTVRDAHGASYTVPAVVMPPGQDTPTYTVTCWAAKGAMTSTYFDPLFFARFHQRRHAVPFRMFYITLLDISC